MGRRSAGSTMAAVVAAFARRPTWTQFELAAEVDTTVRVVRRHLRQLVAAGLDLHRVDPRPEDQESPTWIWRTRMRVGELPRRRQG